MKRTLQRLLNLTGYEITKLNRPGRNPRADFAHLFRGRTPRVVFDVGANEGQTAQRFSSLFPQATIYCFEPHDATFAKLQEAARPLKQVRPVQLAMGDLLGVQLLNINVDSVTNSLLANSLEAHQFQPGNTASNVGSTSVSVSTIDAFCQYHGIAHIDLLKIDTQGYDLRVLRGAEMMIRQGRITAIYVEVLFAPLYGGQHYFHDIYLHLWERSFRFVRMYDLQTNHLGYASWGDALFVQPHIPPDDKPATVPTHYV